MNLPRTLLLRMHPSAECAVVARECGVGPSLAHMASPLSSYSHSSQHGRPIHQDPGTGHLLPAHKCMKPAIKLTLWQLFSHTFDGPVAAHPLVRGYKKVKRRCAKNYDRGATMRPG